MSAAASAAGYLVASHRSDLALGRMQRAMDGIFEGGRKRDARRAAERETKCSTAGGACKEVADGFER